MSKLIDKHRDINVDCEWWEYVYKNFVNQMQEIGIEVNKTKGREKPAIYFSGFWSQGDGACFEGKISNWVLFLKNFDKKYQELHDLSFSWVHSGRYFHEHSMDFTFDYDPEPNEFEKDIQALALELEVDAKEFIRTKAKELYKALEEEYSYLTSDDAVFDTLEVNEYDFTDSTDARTESFT